MRRIMATLAILGAAALLFASGCKPVGMEPGPGGEDGEGGGTPQAERVFLTPVLAERAERGELVATVATTGSAVPLRNRLLRTEEAGRLHFERDWREGDAVEQGQLIARIDSETLRNEITRSEADLEISRENLAIGRRSMESAIREYEIMQDLYSRGIAALRDVEQLQLSMERSINTHRQNEINIRRNEDNLRTLKERLERLEVRAPFDGLLVARTTLEGTRPFSTSFGNETITDQDGRIVSAEYAICGIIDTSRMILRCDLTSRDIDSIRLGQEATARIYAGEEFTITGEVVDIGGSVSQESRTFQVDILVENPEGRLRPGMFGRVEIATDRRLEAISLRKDSITRRGERHVVFVAEEDQELRRWIAREREVEFGLESRDRIEVTWGIQAGDAVIVRGFEVLQDLTPVQVVFPEDPLTPGTPEEEAEATEVEEAEEVEDGGEEGSPLPAGDAPDGA